MVRYCRFLALLLAFVFSVTSAAHAAVHQYSALVDGPQEGTASPGLGFTRVDYDDSLHTLTVDVSFSGLSSPTTASHIHAPTAAPFTGTVGVATTLPTFDGFPLNVTSGVYHHVLDLTSSSSYNPAFVTANGNTTAGAEAALAAAIAAGRSYLNIHTITFGGGEIRGFLRPVPEPTSLVLLTIAALGAVIGRRRR